MEDNSVINIIINRKRICDYNDDFRGLVRMH